MMQFVAPGDKFRPSAALHNATVDVIRQVGGGRLSPELFGSSFGAGSTVIRGRNTSGSAIDCFSAVKVTNLASEQYIASSTNPGGLAFSPVVDFDDITSGASDSNYLAVTQQGAEDDEIVPIVVSGLAVVRIEAVASPFSNWEDTPYCIPSSSNTMKPVPWGGYPIIAPPNNPASSGAGNFALISIERTQFGIAKFTLTADLTAGSTANATINGLFGSCAHYSGYSGKVRDVLSLFGLSNGTSGLCFTAPAYAAANELIVFQAECGS